MEPAAQGDKEEPTPMDEGAETTTTVMEEGEKEEVDVGWLMDVLPSHLLALITSRSPSPAFNRRAVVEGVEVLSALAAAAGEVPSVAQRLATSASAFVDLLLCLLVWHVADYCEDPSKADDDDDDKEMTTTEDDREKEAVVRAGAGGNGASGDGHGAIGERSTAVGRAAATLSSALKTELLCPRPDGWDEGGYVEQPLLDAVLGHEKLDDIIGAFVDSLRVLLHHYQHTPTPAVYVFAPVVAEDICGVVEALYLLCFSDDFAGRLMNHRLFPEGHILFALAHVLALPDAGEAVLASGLGLLAILCEKQQPEFLAIAHLQPPTHAIINTLITLATEYLQKLGQQGKEDEAGGADTASHTYSDATHRRIFHSIELFADHPCYKTALIRPGAEVLWDFLCLPTDVFSAFLKDHNRRPITMHLLHLLISLALPCPTASWEDITGGQAAQQGHAMLVSALRDFCTDAPSSIKPAEGGKRMVANLERVVGTLYEADNIHFPVEHFLTLHTLTAALHSALANPVGLATSATADNTAPFAALAADTETGKQQQQLQSEIEAERQIQRVPDRLNQELSKVITKQGEEAGEPQEKAPVYRVDWPEVEDTDGDAMQGEPRGEKRDHQTMAVIEDSSPGLIVAVSSAPRDLPADDRGGGSIGHNTGENGATWSPNINDERAIAKDHPSPKKAKREADTSNGN